MAGGLSPRLRGGTSQLLGTGRLECRDGAGTQQAVPEMMVLDKEDGRWAEVEIGGGGSGGSIAECGKDGPQYDANLGLL